MTTLCNPASNARVKQEVIGAVQGARPWTPNQLRSSSTETSPHLSRWSSNFKSYLYLNLKKNPAWQVRFPTVRFIASFCWKLWARITSDNSVPMSPRKVPGNVMGFGFTLSNHPCGFRKFYPFKTSWLLPLLKRLFWQQKQTTRMTYDFHLQCIKSTKNNSFRLARSPPSQLKVATVLPANSSVPGQPLHHTHHAWVRTAIYLHSCLSPPCCCLAPHHSQDLRSWGAEAS